MTLGTGLQVVGGPFHDPSVGLILVPGLLISEVAGGTPPLKVRVLIDKPFVDQKCLVAQFRRHRRRWTRSPLSFFRGRNLRRFVEGLQGLFVRVAFYATA
jgi:hypothetical protein